ncbi:esterase/lipase family protein [Leifsonia sp. AG29]|uniref:esterase/lipase family protein n=1 Tax=Leifsonia sp. AG29 TaxID=2598860 RepID=UPI00131C23D7|nr:hypothetical protein [Leifsonia sp. AG29]
MSTHSLVFAPTPFAQAALVAHVAPRRLVVFVHGFGGDALKTWKGFTELEASDDFWSCADLIFFGYKSFRESAKAVADRFRRLLPEHFPIPHLSLAHSGGGDLRDDGNAQYEELFIVAHSLGGLVVRRALLDDFTEWKALLGLIPPRPPTLEANVRLFSPATAGFRPVHLLGALFESSATAALRTVLGYTANFADMQPGSELLTSTRRRTEAIAMTYPEAEAVRARILWANPEDVVINESYDTDLYSQSVDGRSHTNVCRPKADYDVPWRFVATGVL